MIMKRFSMRTEESRMQLYCIKLLKQVAGNIMRLRCIKSIFMVLFAFLSIFAFYHAILFPLFDIASNYKTQDSLDQTCRHPDLDLMNPQIRKHIHDVGELKCNREIDWVETGRGTASINKTITKLHGRIMCKLNYIDRVDDFTTILGKSVVLTSDHKYILLEGDFFFVKCVAENKKEWKNLMSAIYRNETVVDRALSIKPSEHSMKLNVLMYGLDSMSRMHFMRKLPKTYKYLTEVLKASVLTGYNIVGDGTPQALIPILTGQTELELPETRKRIIGAQFVDVYPFAWKNFTAEGYVTAWGEEQPHVGTFTYRLKGFKDQPTDHCMRPFYLKLSQVMKNHSKLCLGNKPRHKLMLDYLRDFFDTYHDVRKFGFAFNSELSHDDYNIIGYADPDIENFLKGLRESGILDNTLLIVMSDHGHRFAPIRATQQGKQEERLPFFSVVVPSWMETKYPKYIQNLKINENRLVTPFDIHATFMTILNPNVPPKGQVTDRSISLFSEIPKERTCSLASIESHWCTCLHWSQMSTTEPTSQQVGQAVIDFMNRLTEFQRAKCEELQLSSVLRLEKLIPNEALLKFKKNADKDGFVGEFTDNTKVTEVIYQVQIKAHPSNGIYESIVKHDTISGAFVVKEDELSRVNMYGNQEHCIHDAFPNLRKYCYCKEQYEKE